ncbi:DNA polymerase III subunit gamma and tau [Sinomonas notoginsengisoli]|uniref:DNA polymerase III subunit gamma and tau n=1 Tax=Sinomonas notoginsengisoli TaxID=1457311 RepID=UPI001F292BDC|nr:DNA polymerase III subunit gamma and tau [Sinomonas notoginsengisoli]
MTAPAALYRRYRPDTFQDVIGQEHVTEPLMTALRKNRVNHAYLFSGPRGCGKTTSARILARCLNCEKGPTPDPCGACPSCVELARGGAGSLDVIEIDAASHGGVDDARDLRERATFAPVRDRYKIFIIDEAHMVTSAGFNALLKIVEEPPEHIKFIFATTEPDKVIGTIRSRTHHYPFRLVPPEPLLKYLEQLCASENVRVAPGVLSLVIRAGGGSVRDSLSVLDQLMAGAGPEGIDYELAVALLGYTHATLLDDVVDAMAANDSGTVFRAVDRVIQTGHDPRRFVEDLLERFRDLIIVQALPDAAESILRGVPADQLARMRVQAQNLGAAELSRAADVTNEAFNEMTGATSPRLHLELLCARLMLPAADAVERGWAARVDRLERRLSFAHDGAGSPPVAEQRPSSSEERRPDTGAESTAPRESRVTQRSEAESNPQATPPSAAQPTPAPVEQPGPAPVDRPVPTVTERSEPPAGERSEAEPRPRPEAQTSAPPTPTSASRPPAPAQGGGAGSVEMFRRAWPEILDALAKVKRSTWALVGPNASVAGFDGRTLALAFGTSGLAAAFTRGDHSANLHQAIQSVLGVDCQIDAVTGGNGPGPSPLVGGDARPKASAEPSQGTSVPRVGAPSQPTAAQQPDRSLAPAQQPAPSPASAPRPEPPQEATPRPAPSPAGPTAPSAADVAWGLTPGLAPQPAAATPQEEPPPQGQHSAKPATQPQARGEAKGPAPQATAPQAPASQEPQTSGGPFDGIPYSDEEPPGEWDEPYPDDAGYGAPRQNPVKRQPPAPAAPGPQGSPTEANENTPEEKRLKDPWSYARESTPGVWSVGTEPNVRPDTIAGSAPSAVKPPAPAESAESAETGAAKPEEPAAAAPSYEPAAAQPPQRAPQPPTDGASRPPHDPGRKLSMYERLSRKAAQERSQAQKPEPVQNQQYVEDIPSADDETIEQSSVFGRTAVERILGGKLIEERSLDGTVIPPR